MKFQHDTSEQKISLLTLKQHLDHMEAEKKEIAAVSLQHRSCLLCRLVSVSVSALESDCLAVCMSV